jgi:hypothetical protein
VADLLDGLARYLDSEGVLDYDAAGVTGNTFIEVVPQTPNRCVSLSIYGGEVPDSKLGYDSVAMQVRTRGTNDPRVSGPSTKPSTTSYTAWVRLSCRTALT